MKNLLKIFILAVAVSFILPSCASDDDFTDIIESSELDVQSFTDDEDDEIEKPGLN